MTTTRSNHPSALWPGIKLWFGARYKEAPKAYREYFQMETSDKAYEEIAETVGLGLAPKKAEGASIKYDDFREGYKTRFTNEVYGLGYIVTREAIEDNQYRQVSESYSRELARSMNATKCIVHANVLNRGFTTFLGGDGVPIFSASHPTIGGLQSNLLTAADLSETSLEDAVTQIMLMENARGIKIGAQAATLVVHPSNWANAIRILESELQSGSATDTTNTNNVNALRVTGRIKKVVVDPWLEDLDAWFLTTDVGNGLLSFQRRALEFKKDDDFDTENAKAKATERYVPGVADWRGVFGNPGSG